MTLKEAHNLLNDGRKCPHEESATVNLALVNIIAELIYELDRANYRIAQLEKKADPHTLSDT